MKPRRFGPGWRCRGRGRRVPHATTNRRVFVRPVLCFPGWYVKGERDADVWVLNTDHIRKWVAKEKDIRASEDVALFAPPPAAWPDGEDRAHRGRPASAGN
jgi:hypothetical protein